MRCRRTPAARRTIRSIHDGDKPVNAGTNASLERVLAMVEDWPDLNEFKATAIPR